MTLIKHKKWVSQNLRLRGEFLSRYKKLRLDKNERISSFEDEFIKKFFKKINSFYLNSYPETKNLYNKLANYHNIKIEQLVITAGSDAAIKNCFDLFVSPKDKVITLNPTFGMIEVYCKLFCARQVKINYNKDLKINIDHFLNKIDDDVSLIIIANPNSPTGTLISSSNMEKIVKKANNYKIPVLVDEAYYGFSKQTALTLLSKFPNIIISRTFSKSYGIAGLRVGYLIAELSLAKLLYSFKPMYEVNSLGILAAEILLDNPNIRKKYISENKKGKELIIKFLKFNSIDFIDSHANFIFIKPNIKKINFLKKLNKHKILIGKDISIKGYEKYIRITTGPINKMKIIISLLR